MQDGPTMAAVALAFIIGAAGTMVFACSQGSSSAPASEGLQGGPIPGQGTATPAQAVAITGTEPAPPVQAGSPGNTLPPVRPYTDTPTPDTPSTGLKFNEIPTWATTVFVGVELSGGPFDEERTLAYFAPLQTPPTADNIYGDLAIFVEGDRIGFRLAPASKIFEYKFDFNRRGKYTVEMKITYESSFVTRVELLIDGAVTGNEFLIKNVNMRDRMFALPQGVELYKKSRNAWLQVETPKKDGAGWGSIRERRINSGYQ